MDEKEKTRTLVFDFYFVFRVSSIISLKLNDDARKMDATVRKLPAESRAPRSVSRSRVTQRVEGGRAAAERQAQRRPLRLAQPQPQLHAPRLEGRRWPRL